MVFSACSAGAYDSHIELTAYAHTSTLARCSAFFPSVHPRLLACACMRADLQDRGSCAIAKHRLITEAFVLGAEYMPARTPLAHRTAVRLPSTRMVPLSRASPFKHAPGRPGAHDCPKASPGPLMHLLVSDWQHWLTWPACASAKRTRHYCIWLCSHGHRQS